MRRFCVRKAKIPKNERDILERFGPSVIGTVLAAGFSSSVPELTSLYTDPDRKRNAALWLTEQYDREERRETWSITMEAAITLFVLAELVFSVLNFLGIHRW
jgi:hypothetical protein